VKTEENSTERGSRKRKMIMWVFYSRRNRGRGKGIEIWFLVEKKDPDINAVSIGPVNVLFFSIKYLKNCIVNLFTYSIK
jgi:hypothetical protein